MNEKENTALTAKPQPSRGHGPMGGGRVAEKPKNFKIALKRLFRFIKPYIPTMLIALVFAVGGTVLTLVGPNQLQKLTDFMTAGLLTGIDVDGALGVCYLLLGLYLGSFVLTYLQGFIMSTVTQKISRNLRTSISMKINVLPLKYFDTTTYGNILSRVTNDVDMIGQTLNNSVTQLVSGTVLLLGATVMMFVTNWIMALAAIGSAVIGFLLMTVIMKHSQKYFLQQQNALGEINGHIEETYSGHDVIKVYNGEQNVNNIFDKINMKLYSSAWKSQFMSGLMMPIMSFIGNLGFVAVCVVGGALALDGKIPFSVIVAFMVYVRLFTQPLSQIAQSATNLQSTAAASERVFEFLDEEELSDESHKTKILETAKGDVEFEHVVFGYDENKTIIKDFSAHAYSGQKIAIVGPTGAGKTTLVNLLMRFYEVNSGNIKIDGVPISELTRANLHDLFGMVLQDTWLFEGTIRENIAYSKTDATDEDIERACKAVGLHHFVKTLPDGYDTVIGDKTSLSQGQKQLVTIARAMVENAPLLILDEATSSVDTRTEELIQKAMDKLTEGRTSFVIAHRLSTIRNADLILVMKDGDIVESGNHEELLKKGGFYADLYNSQFDSAT